MNPKEKLDEIRRRLQNKDYIGGPGSILKVEEDMSFLLEQLEKSAHTIEALQKKADLLLQQNMELTQEMENIRSDFGGDQR